jgi:dephospho-CoA kinase
MTSSPLQIGLTGGIGSGKTTVSLLFKSLGIPIYYADDAAKWLMQHDKNLISAIKAHFGTTIYDQDNTLNRQALANIVFNDATALKQLESLVHPAVQQHGLDWVSQQQDVPYTLKEAALIFETGSYQHLDKVITVFAPESLRIARVQARDRASINAIKARIDNQLPDTKKCQLADYIIYNDNKQLLIPQVVRIHEELCQLANTR